MSVGRILNFFNSFDESFLIKFWIEGMLAQFLIISLERYHELYVIIRNVVALVLFYFFQVVFNKFAVQDDLA